MVINCDKSKVMLFSTGRKYAFMPKLQIDDGTFLEVVEEFKLLGLYCKATSNGSPTPNIYVKRGMQVSGC